MWSIPDIPTVGSLRVTNSPGGYFYSTSCFCFFDAALRLPVTRRDVFDILAHDEQVRRNRHPSDGDAILEDACQQNADREVTFCQNAVTEPRMCGGAGQVLEK